MAQIEELYFNWLCAKVLHQPRFVKNYYRLLEILYRVEFEWSIEGDRNRVEDGCELRTFFLVESILDVDPSWMEQPCSVLEVLIALAKRAEFQTDQPLADWFWVFLQNLGLGEYRMADGLDVSDILRRLNIFMHREYAPNGEGGLFPIMNPRRDQRSIELWYQFCDFVADQGIL